MVTFIQLAKNARVTKKRQLRVPAFKLAPHRKGVVCKITTMPPRKPNSAKERLLRFG